MDPLTIAAVVTTGAKFLSTIAGGAAEKERANAMAKQARAVANRTEALSQREAIEYLRESRLLASRALAMAGASGTDPNDYDVVKFIEEIEDRGEFNMLSALYDGTIRANDMRYEAKLTKEAGKQAYQAAGLSAIADLGTSLYSGGAFTNEGMFGMKGSATTSRTNVLDANTADINSMLAKRKRI